MSVSNPSASCKAGLTMPEFAARIGCSLRKAYKIVHANPALTYMVAGRRRVDERGADLYIEACKVAGPQFGPPVSGKRPKGRPRKYPKSKPETATASAAE
jgi:hypothetical protein